MFLPQSNDDQKVLKITSYLTLRKTSNTGRLVMNSWWGRALWRCRCLHTYYIHFSKLLVSSCVQKVSLSCCSFSHLSICLAHSPRGVFWVQMSLAEMGSLIMGSSTIFPPCNRNHLSLVPTLLLVLFCWKTKHIKWPAKRCLYPLLLGWLLLLACTQCGGHTLCHMSLPLHSLAFHPCCCWHVATSAKT